MQSAPDNQGAYDDAERIRERLPMRLQEIREAAGSAKMTLCAGVALVGNTLAKIEYGVANPTLHLTVPPLSPGPIPSLTVSGAAGAKANSC
jgi:DNA-binding XRE family transcriptional regulator